jgi:hypothetical protein
MTAITQPKLLMMAMDGFEEVELTASLEKLL